MKRYSDLEVDLLIDDISQAAYEAIERAAVEAARAAALAALEREAAALREAQGWRMEVEMRERAVTEAKRAGRRNTILAAVLGTLGGLAFGIFFIGGR